MKINKRLFILTCMMMLTTGTILAANKVTNVQQVTEAVTLSDDVDYVIKDADSPFAITGSVDITNTDHAVLIFKSIKPSKVIKSYLSFIYIKGEQAKNDVNCQVKMYSNGAIVMPYASDIKPLTVYSEPNFGGEAVNSFGLENSGGFMNTLSAAKLNNAIRSFRLKRGYMVTFALGSGGWGYSRCFIADTEDLEIAQMPANMDARISSYRLFKWYDAKKSGLASDTRAEATGATNASWCYDWGTGTNRLPDTECVPNHIYEDWPSPASCGGVNYSCHMKTNNEPGNSSDDHPQDVATVLANWQNLMRTGLRLCSETSHDGSMNHLQAFCDSVDANGWRCDIVDLHCYWDSGQFNNLTWYSDNYGNGRPIWISEWLWGASWNNNGIFGAVSNRDDNSSTTQQKNYNGTKPILDILNSNPRVERYAFWNSERNCSKIYLNGKLTKLGEYYAKMDPGIGFRKSNEFIPKVVFKAPYDMKGTYNKTKKTLTLTWSDKNGDMLDSMVVECKLPGSSSYTQIARMALKDLNGKSVSYTYTDTLDAGGTYFFRAGAYPIGSSKPKYTGEAIVTIGSATGNDLIQYGTLTVGNLDEISVDFDTEFAELPKVFMGIPTNKNTKMYPNNMVGTINKKGFTYTMLPWKQSGEQTLNEPEYIPFMAIMEGNYTLSPSDNRIMDMEIGTAKVKSDTTEVTFVKPFPEGVVPVVIAELKPSLKTNPMMYRIWDVTNTGFKATAMYEVGYNAPIKVIQTLNYLAVTPGQGVLTSSNDEKGMLISAGIGETPLYSTVGRAETFVMCNPDGTHAEDADTLRLTSPYIFGALQTYNMETGAILRKTRDMIDEADQSQYGVYLKRCKDGSAPTSVKDSKATADNVGWICISAVSETVGIKDINAGGSGQAHGQLHPIVRGRTVSLADGTAFSLYTLSGKKVATNAPQNPGIYIVRRGTQSEKIIIR